MIDGSIYEMERCLDNLQDSSVQKIFFGTIIEMRNDLVASLIESGGDEFRFKIKAIDEILGFKNDIYDIIVSEKQSAT